MNRQTYRHAPWAALAVITLALSGCYTALQGPQLASTAAERDTWARATVLDDDLYDSADSDIDAWERDGQYDSSARDNFGRDDFGRDEYYGRGYPVMGAATSYGLYGFGSPFAYGPGLGSAYSYGYGGYGGYGPSYGPYGYGYDPYYSSGYGSGYGNYVPPGYELVTARELANLRTENASLRRGSSVNVVPTVNQQALQRKKQADAERAWEQRTTRDARKSTGGYRTPRTSSTTSTGKVTSSSSGTSKPASSSTKSSGSSAAKKRKGRR